MSTGNKVYLDVSAVPSARALGERLQRRARAHLNALELSRCELSLTLVKDKEIRALNKKWRRKDKATDVLSFPAGDMPGQPRRPLGDVIISVDTAKRQAKEFQNSLQHELDRYLAHGLLHLLGFDHLRPRDAEKMARAEVKLLGRGGMLSEGQSVAAR